MLPPYFSENGAACNRCFVPAFELRMVRSDGKAQDRIWPDHVSIGGRKPGGLRADARTAKNPGRRSLVGTVFGAKSPNLLLDLIPDVAGLLQLFVDRPAESRRIRKRPMQARGHAGQDRTTRSFRVIANSNDIGE